MKKFLLLYSTVIFLLCTFNIYASDFDVKCGTPEVIENFFSGAKKIAARINLQKSVLSAAGHFRVHYDSTGFNSPYTTDKDKNGIPDYVDSTLVYFEYAWDVEVTQLGLLAPLPDNGSGGGTEIDVYIKNFGTGSYGETYPEQTTGGYSAYIVIDNNFAESQYATKSYAALRVTSAHEFFHIIQFHYCYNMAKLTWWMEQSAVWMENRVWDDVNDYLAYLKYFFREKTIPLDSISGNFKYGAVVWPMYLSKKYGDGIIKNIWEYIAQTGHTTLSTLEPVIPGGLEAAYSEFSVWNLFTGSKANTNAFYSEGNLFGYTVSIDSTFSSFPSSHSFSGLDYLTSRYVELILTNSCNYMKMNINPTSGTDVGASLVYYESPQVYSVFDGLESNNEMIPLDNLSAKRYLVFTCLNSTEGDYDFQYDIMVTNSIVTYPSVTGITWILGSMYTITWSDFAGTTVNIDLYKGSTLVTNIATATPNDGTQSWNVPTTLTVGNDYKIRVTGTSSQNDYSNAVFSIVQPVITATAPNGGESWITGSTQDIKWTYTGVDNVKLEYSINGGTIWITILASTPASTGTYAWTVPNVSSNNCIVRVSDASNSYINDSSDSFFLIVSLALISPNGGENFAATRKYDISWTQSGVTQINIDYSTNNGTTWIRIEENIDATLGKYSWTIPDTLSSLYLLRVNDVENSDMTDQSDAVFTVSSAPTIKITSPNGGEEWTIGSNKSITWQSTKIEKLKIECSPDSGASWTTLADSVQSSLGTFSVTLPETPSSNCLIRLSDSYDARFTDTNDCIFSLIDMVFSVDSNLITSGAQDSNYVSGIGGGKYVGFALYSHGWDNVKGFTVSFQWDSSKIQFNKSRSYYEIAGDEIDINGVSFTPDMEQNVFGGSILGYGEIFPSGSYTKSFINTGGVTSNDGLIFFAVFKTAASFSQYDSLSIKAGVTVKNPDGNEKVLENKYFYVLKEEMVIQPPSNFTVSDYPSDNGHQLQLRWSQSPSENDELVSSYRIFRSRNSVLTDPIPITNFASWDSIKYYEQFYTIFVDSVYAGTTEYVDFVPFNNTIYYYWLQAVGSTGASKMVVPATLTTITSSVLSNFTLSNAYPNPFNPSTTIDFSIPSDSRVVIKIYNLAGQEVATLKEEIIPAGRYSVVWNAKGMPSGMYFYKLSNGSYSETKKMMLLK